jgi:hypothetical protein
MIGLTTKPTKTCEELRLIILSEIKHDPRCPPGMDVLVRADKDLGWTAEAKPPGYIAWIADCVSLMGRIARRLRLQYGLAKPGGC